LPEHKKRTHKRIAYIGQKHICYALAPLGVDVFPETEENAPQRLKLLVDSREFGIIFLGEGLYSACQDAIKKIESLAFPAVVILPDITGSHQIALDMMRDKIRKAAGRDIISEEGEGE